jgi:hypothetical protein
MLVCKWPTVLAPCLQLPPPQEVRSGQRGGCVLDLSSPADGSGDAAIAADSCSFDNWSERDVAHPFHYWSLATPLPDVRVWSNDVATTAGSSRLRAQPRDAHSNGRRSRRRLFLALISLPIPQLSWMLNNPAPESLPISRLPKCSSRFAKLKTCFDGLGQLIVGRSCLSPCIISLPHNAQFAYKCERAVTSSELARQHTLSWRCFLTHFNRWPTQYAGQDPMSEPRRVDATRGERA